MKIVVAYENVARPTLVLDWDKILDRKKFKIEVTNKDIAKEDKVSTLF
jgi:hypothetical protein